MFQLVIKPAFKETYGQKQFDDRGYLNSASNKQACFRIIPTTAGPMVQAFDKEDTLHNIHHYKLYLYSIAQQLAEARPDDIAVEDKMKTTFVMGTKAAFSERELSNSVEKLYSDYSDWLIEVAVIKIYALTGTSELKLIEIKFLLDKIQKVYKEQLDVSIKNSMFDVLAEIPYENHILNLFRADGLVLHWLNRLKEVKHSASLLSSTMNDEECKTLNLGVATLQRVTTLDDCEKVKNRLEAMIGVLVNLSDTDHLCEADSMKYLNPLLLKLREFKEEVDSEETADMADICEQLINTIAKEEAPNQAFLPKPKSVEDMGKWLSTHGNLNCLSSKQRVMLQANKLIVFDILHSEPHTFQRCVSNYMPKVREKSAQEGYTSQEVDMFSHLVSGLYTKSHPHRF